MRWFLKTRRRAFLTFLVLTYISLMLFGGCANSFILFPSRQPIDAYTAKRHLVPAADNQQIECWVDRSPGTIGREVEAYVIEFTGNATRAEQVATYAALRWQQRPVECWMVNYPGYGGSTGKADLNAIAPAALTVYDHVARIANGKPIFLTGNSLGTTAALYLATQRPTAGLVLQNPPAIRSLILSKFGWWNLWLLAGPIALQVPTELDSPANAARVTAPAIYLLAQDDNFVVPGNQQKVVRAHAGPKRIISMTGGHNDAVSDDAERQLQQALDWLWQK
jgi:pimeloyl-ACP methyl ester carboxylesterase